MTLPTTARGYADDGMLGMDGYADLVDLLLENVPELAFPNSVKVYAQMRHDPQLAAILAGYIEPITRAHWTIDGTGCRDEVTERAADELGLPIKGADDKPGPSRRRRFSFRRHLRTSLLDQTFGFMPFEQSWAERLGGGWTIDSIQERMPQTIAEIKLNPDGSLKWAKQNARINERSAPPLTTADHRLIWYARQREGSNYLGISLLRAAYGPWLLKNVVMRVHGTTIKRFGMGIPEVEAPDDSPAAIAAAQRYAQMIGAGERSGSGIPPGYKTSWKGMTGSVPDAVAFLNYLDRQMTRSTLMQIMDMATSEHGSRSQGETFMDVMLYAQQSVADQHAEEATTQILVPLTDANFGEDEACPRIDAGDVGADVELTPQEIEYAMRHGLLQPDPAARGWFRSRFGIPAEPSGWTPVESPAAPVAD